MGHPLLNASRPYGGNDWQSQLAGRTIRTGIAVDKMLALTRQNASAADSEHRIADC